MLTALKAIAALIFLLITFAAMCGLAALSLYMQPDRWSERRLHQQG